jgi:hypothetical protein
VRALKLTIPGRFWDSLIYSGRLYLFGLEGNILTLNWDRLIEGWPLDDSVRIAFDCAFRQSDFLYGQGTSRLFVDQEIRSVMQRKFERLAGLVFEVSAAQLRECSIREQPSPFPFPHTDAIVYGNHFYVTTREGVYRTGCSKKNRNPVSPRVQKRWDGGAYSLAASYNSLALATGDDGLYELSLDNEPLTTNGRDPRQIVSQHCTDCHWTFYSIYCSSHIAAGYLAAFKKERSPNPDVFAERRFERSISSHEIFHSLGGYSWGNQDKLCQVSDHEVHIVRYQPWSDDTTVKNLGIVDIETLADTETINLAPWKGGVVSGGNALFGTVIECKNAMVVVPSEGPVQTLPGEPTNWRIFARSVQYENHLHVIYADRLEILSFNQDYLVNQEKKLFGLNANYLGLFPRGASRFGPRRSRLASHQLDRTNHEE